MVPALRALAERGVDPSAPRTIDEEDTYALYHSLLHEQLDNLDLLLELDAQVPQGLDLTVDLVESVDDDLSQTPGLGERAREILARYGRS